MPSPLLDPTSSAYKKARRQYLKTTRNRSKDIEEGWTPFRAAEKKYKARFPPPDLADVLDLALLDDGRAAEVEAGIWKGNASALEFREIGLGGSGTSDSSDRVRKRKAFVLPRIPGLVLLPSFVPHETQRELVKWALADQARYPNETNLDTHYFLPQEGLWNSSLLTSSHDIDDEVVQPRASSVEPQTCTMSEPPGPRQLISNTPASPSTYSSLSDTPKLPYSPSQTASPMTTSDLVPKLRWANLGWYYHWGTKQYDFSKGQQEIGDTARTVCKEAVHNVDWTDVYSADNGEGWGDGGPDWETWTESYEPDAGIVNFYQTKDTLMGHVDRSEVCATSPLVSISLGNAAVFLIGGLTRDVPPVPILLRSGDVVIMSGPACRRAYHGVPRILEGTLPKYLRSMEGGDEGWAPYAKYLSTTRINVNVRQVFPKGFDPGLDNTAVA
ncbi:hypothetical protein DENSPDRAFT_837262 [Dentipellis sp. KUC8613]|nr:hypothetical protein DENSPDRAFT_837262 [Dentipellis sp. KUC8613]